MKRDNIFLLLVIVLILILSMNLTLFAAEDYPTKAISVINPYPPGGSLDVPTRTFAVFAEKHLGKPVVVVYKSGGAGLLGADAGAKAAPDGYTLTAGITTMTLMLESEIANGRKTPFTRQDFITIGSYVLDPIIIVVPYNSPWKTLNDFIKDCKAKPGYYAFSSGGVSSPGHISFELLSEVAGIKGRHVPAKGGGPALAAVVGENVDFSPTFPTSCYSLVLGKKLRALAVQGDKRLKAFPEVPTMKESGIDAEFYSCVGVVAPKGIPGPILEKLRETVAKGVKDKSFNDTLEAQGSEVRYMSGDEMANYWNIEAAKIRKIFNKILKETPNK